MTFTTVATVSPLLTSFTDTGLSSGRTYTYRVVAANLYGTATGPTAKVTPGGTTTPTPTPTPTPKPTPTPTATQPTATASAADVGPSGLGQDLYNFTVVYYGAAGMNMFSLTNQQVQVVNPNGTSQFAALNNIALSADGKTETVLYAIVAPAARGPPPAPAPTRSCSCPAHRSWTRAAPPTASTTPTPTGPGLSCWRECSDRWR